MVQQKMLQLQTSIHHSPLIALGKTMVSTTYIAVTWYSTNDGRRTGEEGTGIEIETASE
jgi:hypothetical protein